MGKPSFLEFDCVNVAKSDTKDIVLCEFINQGSKVHVEHTDGKVWTISSRLERKESAGYFWPERISRKSNEEVKTLIVSCDCNSILKPLIHVPWSTDVRRGKDDTMTNVMKVYVFFSMSDSVL